MWSCSPKSISPASTVEDLWVGEPEAINSVRRARRSVPAQKLSKAMVRSQSMKESADLSRNCISRSQSMREPVKLTLDVRNGERLSESLGTADLSRMRRPVIRSPSHKTILSRSSSVNSARDLASSSRTSGVSAVGPDRPPTHVPYVADQSDTTAFTRQRSAAIRRKRQNKLDNGDDEKQVGGTDTPPFPECTVESLETTITPPSPERHDDLAEIIPVPAPRKRLSPLKRTSPHDDTDCHQSLEALPAETWENKC